MNLRALLLISASLTLTACSHLGANSKDSSNQSLRLPATYDPKSHDPSQTELDNTAIDRPTTLDSLSDELNLISRMRSGFSLPDLKSKDIKQFEKWSSKHPTYLSNLLSRAEPFLFYILEELEKRNIPTEIALLPAIESAYKPNAVSRSKAGGLWQFIPSTAKYYGLRQNKWYDGRSDVIASTNAALNYLEVLNKQFNGDWFLTLAAYNAGPGTLQKAIKVNQRKGYGTQFQDLKLRAETRRYIPKLIALKNIINEPEKYGVVLPSIINQQYFEIVDLPKQVNLTDFANSLQIDLNKFNHLNAGYLQESTPPNGPHSLLIPVSSMQQTAQAIENLNKMPTNEHQSLLSIESNQVIHKVVSGDTLWSIALRYRVNVIELLTWNQITDGAIISLGQILKIVPN